MTTTDYDWGEIELLLSNLTHVWDTEAEITDEIDEEDIKTVVDQAGCSEEDAKAALEETKGDIAEAIMRLQS